jgi:hypothetical protein
MRRLNRRSFLARVAGAAAAGTLAAREARALQATDSDTGPDADPAGRGRGGTGYTDSDGGPYADPAGHGRGRGRAVTDSDTGRYADPVGRGRGRGCTDSDLGNYADPVGRGRRCG